MKKLFDELLRIKRFREEQAEWGPRAGMARAERARGEAEEALEQYRARRAGGRTACRRSVQPVARARDRRLLQQVAGLKEGERRRDAAREDALRKEVEAREARTGRGWRTSTRCASATSSDPGRRVPGRGVQEQESKEDAEVEEAASTAWRPREWDEEIEETADEHG